MTQKLDKKRATESNFAEVQGSETEVKSVKAQGKFGLLLKNKVFKIAIIALILLVVGAAATSYYYFIYSLQPGNLLRSSRNKISSTTLKKSNEWLQYNYTQTSETRLKNTGSEQKLETTRTTNSKIQTSPSGDEIVFYEGKATDSLSEKELGFDAVVKKDESYIKFDKQDKEFLLLDKFEWVQFPSSYIESGEISKYTQTDLGLIAGELIAIDYQIYLKYFDSENGYSSESTQKEIKYTVELDAEESAELLKAIATEYSFKRLDGSLKADGAKLLLTISKEDRKITKLEIEVENISFNTVLFEKKYETSSSMKIVIDSFKKVADSQSKLEKDFNNVAEEGKAIPFDRYVFGVEPSLGNLQSPTSMTIYFQAGTTQLSTGGGFSGMSLLEIVAEHQVALEKYADTNRIRLSLGLFRGRSSETFKVTTRDRAIMCAWEQNKLRDYFVALQIAIAQIPERNFKDPNFLAINRSLSSGDFYKLLIDVNENQINKKDFLACIDSDKYDESIKDLAERESPFSADELKTMVLTEFIYSFYNRDKVIVLKSSEYKGDILYNKSGVLLGIIETLLAEPSNETV